MLCDKSVLAFGVIFMEADKYYIHLHTFRTPKMHSGDEQCANTFYARAVVSATKEAEESTSK